MPDLIIIGAMKCATSMVSVYLEDHGDVFMYKGSPNYFSNDRVFARGPDWYDGLFAGAGPGQLTGEGSNDYAAAAMYPDAAARLAAHAPEARLVYMVRHPVDRLVSAWIQNRADQGDAVPPTLDRAIAEMPERFVDQSLYWHQLERYRAHFADARIFVGFVEDLEADRAAFFARLCGFLGIPPAPVARPRVNVSQGKRVPGRAYSTIRAVPGLGALARLIPRGARHWVKDRLLSRPVTTRPEFSPQVRADLLAKLAPDAAALLAHCAKPADFWDLGP